MSDKETERPARIAAILLAAGSGVRAGLSIPKQFSTVQGKPLFRHSLDRFLGIDWIEKVVLVVGKDQLSTLNELIPVNDRISVITGGDTRQQSVRNALESLASGKSADQVFIHDTARPFVPMHVLESLRDALEEYPGVTPVLPMADTVTLRNKGILGEVVERDSLVRIQTPQAFDFETVLAAHRAWQGGVATDDAQMVRALGHEVALTGGSESLAKFTYAEHFVEQDGNMAWRTGIGTGFDVHRLQDGKELWLCGVKLDHHQGLAGHSDADVALHALTDAVLGAVAAGDIGDHFPPSDSQWKGVSSDRFLTHAIDLARAKGGIIDHLDLTIICERPKVGPYKAAMQQRVAEIADILPDRVSIKATTTERLGFTGRGEGIAAQAVASVRLPA